MNLATLTAFEVQNLDREKTVVFFPLGTTEQHGPHLPLGTKGFISEAITFEAGKRLKKDGFNFLVSPTFPYSSCQISFGFPSNFSINGRIFSDLIFEVGQSFQREGFKYFFVVNSSISPDSLKAVSEAVSDLNSLDNFNAFDPLPVWIFSKKPIVDAFLAKLGVAPDKEVHGDIKETSSLLYLDSSLVQERFLQELPSVELNMTWESLKGNFSFYEMGAKEGYLGNPAKSDPQLGKLYVEEGGVALAEAVRTALSGQPLPQLPLGIRMLIKLIDLDDAG